MKRLVLGCLLLGVVAFSFASERGFPEGAKRATAKIERYPLILINKKEYRLAPGARIWNAQNLIEMPVNFVGKKLLVNYTLDMNGDVDRIWALSDVESRMPEPDKLN